ncbi:hypothetical protein J2X16_004108 [Pelomonas aquatica]|uniref:DUF2834 domain-containing protein n=1 Tax=Pelomonas aquatica TaxID=431058 RepID=A0ABU1ZFL0_9BURK|nr:DUF2834 domain-containing protein [Pelomonas aquatica]MDR7298740.1 hypothetical protein [Pelomonas aquatica]
MRTILFIVLAAFGAFSLYAMWQVGYVGIWQAGMASVGAWQVLLDLVVMSFIALGFIWRDAKRNGRTVWPYAVLTVAAGSFGPLLYLLLQPAGRPGLQASHTGSVAVGR